MPYLIDSPFSNSVVYICGHDETGTMGLMINKTILGLSFFDLLKQVDLIPSRDCPVRPVLYGGPSDISRGFVLHTLDYRIETTVTVNQEYGITSTLDILKVIANVAGPKESLVFLGYSGWATGQLEQEIADNGWLIADATHELVFLTPIENKWRAALASMKIDPALLSIECGHA